MSDASDAALHAAVQRWAREIRYKSGWTVETILATGEKLLAARRDLEPYGPKARAMLAAEARLSRPMMSRLEAIGRHAGMFRLRAANLPPYVSSLYALTQKPFADFKKAIETDLRGMSRAEIARLFAPLPRQDARRKLMTIAIPAGVADERRRAVTADIRAALERIGEEHGIGFAISPRRTAGSSRRLPAPDRPRQSAARSATRS
jgi:hypothetical protein